MLLNGEDYAPNGVLLNGVLLNGGDYVLNGVLLDDVQSSTAAPRALPLLQTRACAHDSVCRRAARRLGRGNVEPPVLLVPVFAILAALAILAIPAVLAVLAILAVQEV